MRSRISSNSSSVSKGLADPGIESGCKGRLTTLFCVEAGYGDGPGGCQLRDVADFSYEPVLEPERRDFWETCEDRCQMRSTILTSQLPVSRWHEQIGDPTFADGILDRLVHSAHRIEMRGESMRKLKAAKPER